jgi:hypothetical protein
MQRPDTPIVTCTHSDAQKLKPTTDHLKHQRLRSNFQWEVPAADNASTDLSGDGACAPAWRRSDYHRAESVERLAPNSDGQNLLLYYSNYERAPERVYFPASGESAWPVLYYTA